MVLDPSTGQLVFFKRKEDSTSAKAAKDAEIVNLKSLKCAWGPSGRAEMRKSKVECSIELDLIDGEIVLLGAHDRDQVSTWLAYV